MKLKIEERLQAISLRERGYSVNEIVSEIDAAKSSISTWVRNVPLTKKSRDRLLTKIKLGQLVSAENKRKKTAEIFAAYKENATKEISHTTIDSIQAKMVCSLLYWCEGAKSQFGGVRFTNSDPKLIRTFLVLFRRSFRVDESKMRVCLHLHEYHRPEKQINFWSRITKISKRQFIKSYLKPNTGKRIRKDYPGCATIYYHSNMMARELLSMAEMSLQRLGD